MKLKSYEQAKSSAQPQQLKSAEARVDELQLSLKNAQDRLKRIEKLYERDYVTDQEIEDALPQGLDQVFVLMEDINQGRDQGAAGKQGGHNEQEGGHGAVPQGPV